MDYHKYVNVYETIHPSLRTNKLPNLVTYCQKKGYSFKDKEFFADRTSLIGKNTPVDYDGQFDVIEFKTAHDLFKGNYCLYNEISPCDIRQGALGNCYFLCSLSALAEYPDLIKRLFDFDYCNDYGIQSVWLNLNGIWTQIILDEYFPSYFNGIEHDLAFSKTDQNELWVLLLEKAYAKAYGSYWEIIGGDPVHALRDLTGAPYDRIEDFNDLDAAWKKLSDANSRRYMITCFTKSTDVVEEKNDMGIVAGHAYTILDVRDIIDTRGRPARVVQIRNPWGKFEWNGDFSDSSPLWTPKQRQEFDIRINDDGIFWMRLEDFITYYQGIGIVKIVPDSISNAVMVDQKVNKTSILRLSVDEETKMSISVDQHDSRLIDHKDYSYSYFRITIGRLINKNDIQFVDSVLSPERNIFIENLFPPGDYIILVEPYWSSQLINKFNVGTYSDKPVLLELLQTNSTIYRQAEYMIWKNFAKANIQKLSFKGSRKIGNGQNTLDLETYQYQNKKYASILYNYVNKSLRNTLNQNVRIVTNTGFILLGKQVGKSDASLLINPQDNDILLYKMDPRSNGFALSHQVASEEVIAQKFPEDASILVLIASLGGVQPTPENPDPNIVSRNNKQEINDKYRQEQKQKNNQQSRQKEISKKAEEERKRQLELEKKKVEEERKRQAEYLGKQYGHLYQNTGPNDQNSQYRGSINNNKKQDCTIF